MGVFDFKGYREETLRSSHSKTNNSDTGTPSWFENTSRFSNDGALMPRSIRLRKSTEMPRSSANCSWLMLREDRIPLRRWPKFSRKLGN